MICAAPGSFDQANEQVEGMMQQHTVVRARGGCDRRSAALVSSRGSPVAPCLVATRPRASAPRRPPDSGSVRRPRVVIGHLSRAAFRRHHVGRRTFGPQRPEMDLAPVSGPTAGGERAAGHRPRPGRARSSASRLGWPGRPIRPRQTPRPEAPLLGISPIQQCGQGQALPGKHGWAGRAPRSSNDLVESGRCR